MAQWPIVRTQRTMPGRAGGTRGSLNIPDDAQRTWREVQGLFEDIGDEVKRRRLQRIANQTAEFKVRYAEEEEKFSAALAKNQDESTYPAEYEKFNNNVSSSFMPKDPLAAQAAQLYVRAKAPAQRKMIRMLQDAKIKDTWFAHYGQQMTDAEQGKISLNEFKFTQMEGVALGHIKKEQAGDDFRETEHIAERQKMEVMAGNNPDWWQKNVKNQDDMKKYFPKSLPSEYSYINGIVTNQKNRMKQQEDAAMASFYRDISDKAAKGMPFLQMRELIINQPGLTVEEREKAMTVFSSAASTWGEGGTKQDSFKTTQDQGALLAMQIRISQGKPTTEMDIIKAQYAEPEKGPLFSNIDRDKLFTQLPDNDKKPELKTEFAKLNQELVRKLYTTEEYESRETVSGKLKDVDRLRIPIKKQGEYQSKLDEVNALISAYPNNPVRAQQEINKSLEGLKEEKAKGLLRSFWEATSPLGIAVKFAGISKDINKTKTIIPKTEAEKEYAEMSDEELQAIAEGK